ncbi:EcsC family protein [Polaribacter sp.]|nr:EcsC family protein [Polaribacter sp.]
MELTQEHDLELRIAKELLENPSFAAKVTNYIGAPIEKGIDSLPENWKNKIGVITQKSLLKAADVAVFTMKEKPEAKSSNLLHKIAVATSGGVGGFFGLAGLAVELPISTTIMLRSIIDISREYGESISTLETKLACLEVFALGGNSDADDGSETGYFATRTILAKSIGDFANLITEKAVIDSGAPIIMRLISKITERFSVQISEKIIGQSVPFVGAIGGGIINTLFMNHFQDMATGHFIVRKLERIYGVAVIKAKYKLL